MFFLRLWNYIRGYVIIIISGNRVERFINICASRRILLWNLKRIDKEKISANVSIKGYELLKEISLKSNCKYQNKAQIGLPFKIINVKKRKGYLFGVLFFIVFIMFFNSIVWNINIDGEDTIEENEIRQYLYSMGLKVGISIKNIDNETINALIKREYEDVAWVETVIRGTTLTINIVERKPKPDIIPVNKASNLVANKPGIIKNMIVKEGQACVSIGDTVQKGQMLVTGNILVNEESEEILTVHSQGSVIARTWYEYRKEIENRALRTVYTGDSDKKIEIIVFEKHFILKKFKKKFLLYDVLEIERELFFGNIVIPIGVKIFKNVEKQEIIIELNEEEAKELAINKAYIQIHKDIPRDAEVVNREVQFDKKNDVIYVDVVIECTEDIAKQETEVDF